MPHNSSSVRPSKDRRFVMTLPRPARPTNRGEQALKPETRGLTCMCMVPGDGVTRRKLMPDLKNFDVT
jgi:hypothetical protein